MYRLLYALFFIVPAFSCHQDKRNAVIAKKKIITAPSTPKQNSPGTKVIHIFVALCDNKYQGVVPVPAGIGNGQDPAGNLYWGCGYGVKGFFSKHKNWRLVATQKAAAGSMVLERLVFTYNNGKVYMIADAYDGKAIRQCTVNFLKSCSGSFTDSIRAGNKTIYCGGASQLLSYIGHDGLMDFNIEERFPAADNRKREAMIFACISKQYFARHISSTGAVPVVWTTGLCSPEAYSLSAALESRLAAEPVENAAVRAAEAYHRYQHCGIKAAKRLMVYN